MDIWIALHILQAAAELSGAAGYVERFGIAAVVAGLFFFLIYKVLIPALLRQNERIVAQSEKTVELLTEQLKRASETRTREIYRFEAGLKRISISHNQAMNKVSEALEGLTREIREGRDGEN